MDGDLLLAGGTVRNATLLGGANGRGLVGTDSDGVLENVALNGGGLLQTGSIVTVRDGFTLNGLLRIERTINSNSGRYDSGINFAGGDQTLGGTGTVELYSTYNSPSERYLRVRPTAGGSLTIGPGITLRNATNSRFATIGTGSLPLTILGTIVAQSPGNILRVTGSNVVNQGVMRAQGGHLDVNNARGDLGDATVTGGGTLDVAGTFTNNLTQNVGGSTLIFSGAWNNSAIINASSNATLNFSGKWSNNSSISATDSTVNLLSHADDLGTFSATNTRVNLRSKYTTAELQSISHDTTSVYVEAGGTLDNTADQIDLSAAVMRLFLNGGVIEGGTIASADGTQFIATSNDGSLKGVTLDADTVIQTGAIVTASEGLTVNGLLRIERTINSSSNTYDTGINFSGGDQTLGGTGTVELFSILTSSNQENDVRIYPTEGGSLTIGPNITVRNASDSRFTTIGTGSLPLTILGTIVAQSPGNILRVTGSNVVNQGVMRAQGGHLDVNNARGDLGDATVTGGGTLDVAGTFTNNLTQNVGGSTLIFSGAWNNSAIINASSNATLNFSGKWSNNSSISATDSTVNLLSHADDLGTFSATNTRVNLRSKYTTAELQSISHDTTSVYVEAGGTLDNTADQIDLSAAVMRLFLNGGVIEGGTIASADGTQFIATSNDGSLKGVTLDADTVIQTGAIVTASEGLTVNGLLRIERTINSSSNTYDTGINFSGGDQTLGGTGTVELFSILTSSNQENDVRIYPTEGGSLTIGPNITVRNASDSRFTTIGTGSLPLTILGTIVAQSPGNILRVTGSNVVNQGVMRAQGGHLDVNNARGDLGDATVTGGGTLDVAGTFTNNLPQTVDGATLVFSGDWANTADIQATNGSTMNFYGSWSNSGSITATDSTVNLYSHADDLGTFSATNTRINLLSTYPTSELQSITHDTTLMYVEAGGKLDNTADQIDLSTAGIRLFLNGGVIEGGTIASADGTKFIATSNDGSLKGVTLDADAVIQTGAIVTASEGLTVNGLLRIERTINSSSNSYDTGINFSGGDQTLGGTGTVELFSILTSSNQENDVRIYPTEGGSLTIGPNITVRNASDSRFTTIGTASLPLTILGTIISQSPGQTLRVTGSNVSNQGTLVVQPGARIAARVLAQASTGATEIGISGDQPGEFGTIAIDGQLQLDGILRADVASDAGLGAGQLDVFTFGSVLGAFADESGLGVSETLTLELASTGDTSAALLVVPTAVDSTAPTLSEVVPPDNSSATRTQDIELTFSERMDPATLTAANFSVVGPQWFRVSQSHCRFGSGAKPSTGIRHAGVGCIHAHYRGGQCD